MMRTDLLLYISAIALLLSVSCKEKKEEEERKENILGSWESTRIITTGCDDPADDRDVTFTCSDTLCITYEFEKDGTFTGDEIFGEDSEGTFGTWEINGTELTICEDIEGTEVCEDYELFVSSSQLTVEYTSEDGCNTEITFQRVVPTP